MQPLNEFEKSVILEKGTEKPFSGKYDNFFEEGLYHCRNCGLPLYTSQAKFRSGCGWPSFDDELAAAVQRKLDLDGKRTEILCAACNGHLGHVFHGEKHTARDTRHCVNSVSVAFQPTPQQPKQTDAGLTRAVFAGGCFWGVEHHFQQIDGVKSVTSGYSGGYLPRDFDPKKNPELVPTYERVKTGKTGHAEAVEVIYDAKRCSFEKLARRFFEIHNPEEALQQGPDKGSQYRSVAFYFDNQELAVLERLLEELRENGYEPQTQLLPAMRFFAAEDVHQNFFAKHPERAICHAPVQRFNKKKGSQ